MANNFTLQSTSPCIDTGTDVSLALDYAGSFVPCNTTPDMGALEYIDMQPATLSAASSIPTPSLIIGVTLPTLGVLSTASSVLAPAVSVEYMTGVSTGPGMGMGIGMGM